MRVFIRRSRNDSWRIKIQYPAFTGVGPDGKPQSFLRYIYPILERHHRNKCFVLVLEDSECRLLAKMFLVCRSFRTNNGAASAEQYIIEKLLLPLVFRTNEVVGEGPVSFFFATEERYIQFPVNHAVLQSIRFLNWGGDWRWWSEWVREHKLLIL